MKIIEKFAGIHHAVTQLLDSCAWAFEGTTMDNNMHRRNLISKF